MEGGLVVQGRKVSAGAEEEANPPEGGVGETMVPKKELFLRSSEVGVGGVEDVRF